MKPLKGLLLILPLALTTSCMVGPNYQTPNAKLEGQWTYNSSPRQTKRLNTYWWKTFKDPVLNKLIEVAYQNNLTQQIAGVRILQARAQLNASIGNLFPQQQGFSGALNYTKLSTPDRSSRAGIVFPRRLHERFRDRSGALLVFVGDRFLGKVSPRNPIGSGHISRHGGLPTMMRW